MSRAVRNAAFLRAVVTAGFAVRKAKDSPVEEGLEWILRKRAHYGYSGMNLRDARDTVQLGATEASTVLLPFSKVMAGLEGIAARSMAAPLVIIGPAGAWMATGSCDKAGLLLAAMRDEDRKALASAMDKVNGRPVSEEAQS